MREKIRNLQFKEPTCGFAEGFTHTNLVVVPKKYADDFELFCKFNPKPCPLIERLEVGSFEPKNSAPDADLRTDLVFYKKFINGEFIEGKNLFISDKSVSIDIHRNIRKNYSKSNDPNVILVQMGHQQPLQQNPGQKHIFS